MFIRVALYALAVLAAAGLAYSAAVNLWTYSADSPAARFPGFSILQFSIFPIVGGSAILAAAFMRKRRSERWEESLFVRIPIVLRFAILGLALYAVGLSVEQTMIGDVGAPAVRDGQYVLHSHGKVIRMLTAEEYANEQAGDARVSTAIHMAFYVAALSLTVACLRKPKRAMSTDSPQVNAPALATPPVEEAPAPKSRPAWRV